ncbi:cupin domain-containing protein [Microvirga pakistanensis]|uniref:cupin domain-containing protein n=1 Tax=Microvirga pakistanensis TaxID=1682650 RepID=UPI00141A6C43|nr:cupin domain-containing protein [Microvirga pakistanensis]
MSDTKPSSGAVLRPSEIKAADRGGGAKTIPLVSRKVGSTSLLNGITSFEPGAAIPLHKHNCEESVMILEGRAIAEIDGVEHELGPLDTTWLPADVPHRFRNASDTQPMRIFWTYASVDATRTLIATGETRPISAEHAKGAAQ